MLGEADVKRSRGCDKELVQGTLLFHVEQLREMTKEVKGHFAKRGTHYGETEFDVTYVDVSLSRGFRWNLSRATSSTEIAAGVTPEIRDAWPMEAGRTRLSFSLTSLENPRTWS